MDLIDSEEDEGVEVEVDIEQEEGEEAIERRQGLQLMAPAFLHAPANVESLQIALRRIRVLNKRLKRRIFSLEMENARLQFVMEKNEAGKTQIGEAIIRILVIGALLTCFIGFSMFGQGQQGEGMWDKKLLTIFIFFFSSI
jgi:hypothetical protein